MNENSICGLAWTHAAVFPDQMVKPCCRFQTEETTPNYSDTDLDGSRDSSIFQNARLQMLKGKLPPSCRKCEMEELSGHRSMRQKVNQEYDLTLFDGPEKGDLKSIEWFLGNACNLRCVMCAPDRSYSWNKDAEVMGYQKKPLSRLDVKQLDRFLPSLRKIKLIGGEPLLHKEHEQILELIAEKGCPEETHLILNSNLTIFPSEQTRSLWKRFKLVELDLSLDGVGPINEYIRYPTKWSVVEANLAQYLDLARKNGNFLVYITCTISAYNAMYLAEIYDWWESFRGGKSANILSNICWNFVMVPEHMSPFVLPIELRKNSANELLKRNATVGSKIQKSLMSNDLTHLLPKFLEVTERLDVARGIKGGKILSKLESVWGKQLL